MSAVDDYLENNKEYARTWAGDVPGKPARRIAVVACMDSRLDVLPMLGMTEGDAHVLRNAGGVVTDDMIRSLAISQRLLGTTEIMLIHHTDCGMVKTSEDSFKNAIEAETGIRPSWAVEAFTDITADVRQSIGRIKTSPFIPHKDAVRGFVFDVATGTLDEVI